MNPQSSTLWMQEGLQEQIQQYSMEQKVHRTQRVQKNWTLYGDKNTKYFQIMETLRKRQITYEKSMMNMESGLWTKMYAGY